MNKYKKVIALILIVILMIALSELTLAEDNAGSGDGDTRGAVKGKGFYRSGEWMYKASIYVGNKDTAETNSSFYHN